MDSKLCILNIGAHPADIVDDAGGTTILHTDRGDRVVCVTLTLGTLIHDKVLDEYRKADKIPDEAEMTALFEQRTAVKRQEVVDACKVLALMRCTSSYMTRSSWLSPRNSFWSWAL